MAVQFLLDEHLSPLLRQELVSRHAGLVVWVVGDPGAPRHGTSDPEILSWCERQDVLLVTRNRRSMPGHLKEHVGAGRHVPGILLLRPRSRVADVLESLALIWAAAAPDEFRDRLVHVPLW